MTGDDGGTWSSIDNQPTGQVYRVAVDDRFPCRVHGAQQDDTAVAIASRTRGREIGREERHGVGGCESGWAAPKPGDRTPHLWKTADDGASWTRIDAGLPRDAFTRVVRKDSERRGLLFSGSDAGTGLPDPRRPLAAPAVEGRALLGEGPPLRSAPRRPLPGRRRPGEAAEGGRAERPRGRGDLVLAERGPEGGRDRLPRGPGRVKVLRRFTSEKRDEKAAVEADKAAAADLARQAGLLAELAAGGVAPVEPVRPKAPSRGRSSQASADGAARSCRASFSSS